MEGGKQPDALGFKMFCRVKLRFLMSDFCDISNYKFTKFKSFVNLKRPRQDPNSRSKICEVLYKRVYLYILNIGKTFEC